MARARIGLDWFDLLLHAGITFALAVAVSAASRENPEALVGLVVAGSLGVLGWRRMRARRNAPAITSDEVPAERLFALEDRLAELEAQQGRMLELEERLDFAERLLAQQREAPRLGAREVR